jgi:hypothetical protein
MVRAFTHYYGTEPTLSIIFEFIAKLVACEDLNLIGNRVAISFIQVWFMNAVQGNDGIEPS